MKIALTVGHSILKGGQRTSASGYINEYRYNKALAPYVKEELELLGHKCDLFICPEYTFTNASQERTYKLPKINNGGYDRCCELHLNAFNGTAKGEEVYYYSGDSTGGSIATIMSKNIASLGFDNRGAKGTRNLYMITQTKPTAILVEAFFCDNKKDSDLANSVGYRKMAKAIAYGLVQKTYDGKSGGGGVVNPEPPKENNTSPQTSNAGYYVKTSTKGDVLNVRDSVGNNGKIMSTLQDGSIIYVESIHKNTSGTWYKIRNRGYVHSNYCVGISKPMIVLYQSGANDYNKKIADIIGERHNKPVYVEDKTKTSKDYEIMYVGGGKDRYHTAAIAADKYLN
ncbi:N-acetylmuramoyl-L-alanine amidase [Peptostreptococcus faecalis]|uniref:N-acetylmuramoyl-L-alanine amidase n=1 Tax=Peptostreptococcus faecalis TaxID=2045015 RepID=UPI000C79B6A3|nr:N-acetylmuramoyl-L-alanine amidase [Peptostreptococcus faecalis]